MSSYGYHEVSFEGSEAAKRAAGTKLAAGLDLDALDNLPDLEDDDVFFCGEHYSAVVDDTHDVLLSIARDGDLREIRYHACEGDAGGSFAWHWTAEGGARTLDDRTFTTSFEAALAVDRLLSSGEGRAELARRLIADPMDPRDDMLEAVERLGLSLLAFDGSPADELSPDELSALVRVTRDFLRIAEDELGWREDDIDELSERLGIAEAAVEAGRLSAEARPGREGKARPKL